MTRFQHRSTDERMYHAAEDAFTSEGGGSIPAAATQRALDMKEFAIRRDGLRYEYRGYHYDLLSDALGYARLLRSREQSQAQHQSVQPSAGEPPRATPPFIEPGVKS